MSRQGVIWSISALLGIICAASIAWAASQLAGQHIGLASEPLSVARGLAPVDREAQSQRGAENRGLRQRPIQARRRPTRSVPPTNTATSVLPQITPSVITGTTGAASGTVPPPAASPLSGPSSAQSGGGSDHPDENGGGSGGGGGPDD